jgi:DNA-binding NtrC family response regulator
MTTNEASSDETIDATQQGGPSAPVALAYLLVRQGEATQVIDLHDGDEVVLGRGAEATVALDDARASREHARVARRGEVISVVDLGSRNGTRLNGQMIAANEERRVRSGDVIGIGHVEIVVAETSATRLFPDDDDEDEHGRRDAEAGPPAGEPHPQPPRAPEGVVVADAAMVRVFELVRRVAPTPTTVLIQGETGVGKEVFAEQLHAWSPRHAGPFVRLNCGSLPETLLESELFGYEKGAFTGADRKKEGHLDAADGGTLLLDEIGELQLSMQAKLLRVLETQRFMRVGGREEISVDVRLVAATNRDLQAEVRAGRFREDLFFRLAAFTIDVPPLRERPTEIALLAELFLRRFAERMARPLPMLAPDAAAALLSHRWPGNVRELRNAIERALVLSDAGVVRLGHLPDALRGTGGAAAPAATGAAIKDQVAELELRAIEAALAAEKGNQTRAARRLGISRRALIYKLEKYHLK